MSATATTPETKVETDAPAVPMINVQIDGEWKQFPKGTRLIEACTLTSVRLVRELIDAIGLLLPLAGMNAIHREDPFAIAWHDLNAAAAHYSVSPLGDLRKD